MRGSFAYRRRPRLPAPTARLRLTLLYAGMLVVLGTVAFGLTYALTSHTATISVAHANPSVMVTPTPSPGSTAGAGVSRRLLGLPGAKNVVGQQHSADQKRLLGVSALVLALSAIASVALGWFVSGRILRPLRQITATARTISAGNLSERLALRGPNDEFRQLGDTLDDLLTRLESAFEAQRRFVANASHELRTPLTLERTLLQVALADPDADAAKLRATCQELLASGREQERLLEALLTLASSERGLDHRVPFDLAPLAERAVAGAQPDIARRGLAVVTNLAAAPATGDPALAERLATNLVDNAVRYNVPDGRIEVRTATERGGVALSVTNTGPVVSPWDIERLFEPFQRLDPARIGAHDGHHGLGLSIVRAIADAHDGRVVANPLPDGGLAVTVTLPIVARSHRTPPPRA
ncbi:MAG TPA: HAMP domain-containing sensor histidine kinase [Solirubrobacteraceae bacterium]|nr:HAMP domain-containing sensor histidine kinase [Solirubrobacteraceae bacterium]